MSAPIIPLKNNLDFLRFIAASAVLYSHSYPLYGYGKPDLFVRLTGHLDTLGGFSVSIFFIISGFLITASWQRKPDLIQYFKNRLLRIIPALFVVVILTIFVLGPLVTQLSVQEYFSSSATYKYFLNAGMLTVSTQLPGVFVDNPIALVVNGSLWTLPVEFFMYMVVAFLGVLGLISKKTLPYILLITLFVFMHMVHSKMHIMGGSIPVYYAAKHAISFISGMLIFIYFKNISFSFHWFIFFLAATLIALHTKYAVTVIMITLPYMVIFLAFSNLGKIHNFGKYGDFSYGLYIYAFPVQQLCAQYFKGENMFIYYMFACYAITFLLAFLSWHLVEKHALKLKYTPLRKWCSIRGGRATN